MKSDKCVPGSTFVQIYNATLSHTRWQLHWSLDNCYCVDASYGRRSECYLVHYNFPSEQDKMAGPQRYPRTCDRFLCSCGIHHSCAFQQLHSGPLSVLQEHDSKEELHSSFLQFGPKWPPHISLLHAICNHLWECKRVHIWENRLCQRCIVSDSGILCYIRGTRGKLYHRSNLCGSLAEYHLFEGT